MRQQRYYIVVLCIYALSTGQPFRIVFFDCVRIYNTAVWDSMQYSSSSRFRECSTAETSWPASVTPKFLYLHPQTVIRSDFRLETVHVRSIVHYYLSSVRMMCKRLLCAVSRILYFGSGGAIQAYYIECITDDYWSQRAMRAPPLRTYMYLRILQYYVNRYFPSKPTNLETKIIESQQTRACKPQP